MCIRDRSRVDRRRFVQAEISNVNHYYTTGFELGFRYRKLLTYGEYIYNNISRYIYGANNQKTDLKNAVFNGCLLYTSDTVLIVKWSVYSILPKPRGLRAWESLII